MKRTPAVAAMLTLLLSAVCGAEPELCFSFEDEALPGVAGKAADAAGQVRELVPEKAGFPGGRISPSPVSSVPRRNRDTRSCFRRPE